MKKVSICHISSVHPPTDTRIFHKECVSLAAAGYDTHLVVAGASTQKKNGVLLHGVKRNNSQSRLKRMTETLYRVVRESLAVDATLYHFHDPEMIPFGVFLKLIGKKVIYDAHEDTPRDLMTREYIPKPLKKIVSILVEIIEETCGKRLDAVVAATPHIYERYKRAGVTTVCVSNFPISTEFSSLNAKHRFKENAFCYVGAIARERGIFEVIDALPRAGTKLYLGGRFSEQYQYEQAVRMAAWKNVVELGHLDRLQISEVFSRSLAGIVTFHPEQNHINAQPNKLFEYMSASIPVIASNFPSWRRIIETHGCGLLVDPYDSLAIADAMKWIMRNPEKAEEMGRRGREAVEVTYNWNNEFNKLHRLYSQLL